MKRDMASLYKLIKKSGLKSNHICKEVGIHRSYLWMILNGTRSPSEDILNKIFKLVEKK